MTYCGQCGETAADSEQFCVSCGLRLRRPGSLPAQRHEFGLAADDGREHAIVLRHAVRLIASGDTKTALVPLERLRGECPDLAIARAYLGIAYLRETRVADARAELEESVRLAPGSFICRSKYGELLARLGFYDQAMSQLDAALLAGAPDLESRMAAMELREFCKGKAKGIFYRKTASPFEIRLGNLLPRRGAPAATPIVERGT